jgi:hypothetical protein
MVTAETASESSGKTSADTRRGFPAPTETKIKNQSKDTEEAFLDPWEKGRVKKYKAPIADVSIPTKNSEDQPNGCLSFLLRAFSRKESGST